MQNLTYNLKRTVVYIVGFILFYEPFMFFNQIASTFITDTSFSSIHVPCARIPLANIVTGEWLATSTISLIFCLLLAVTSLWFGPLFCGKLCPTGAFSELLGSLLPDKYKIDWVKLVPVLPLRYGFLIGFLFFHLAGLWHSLHLLQLLFFRDFYQLVSHRIFLKHALLAHRHVLFSECLLRAFHQRWTRILPVYLSCWHI